MTNKFLKYSGAILAVLILSITYYFQKINSLNIEDYIIKVTKKAEIINNYENQLESYIPNIEESISSGFYIDESTIITVAHGVNTEKSSYLITDKSGNEYEALLFEKDTENDIALLKINFSHKDIKHNYSNNINIGDEVYSINYSLEKKSGIIKKIENGKIYTNIKFKEGDSGSPLLNTKNNIIGINIEVDTINNLGISIPLKN